MFSYGTSYDDGISETSSCLNCFEIIYSASSRLSAQMEYKPGAAYLILDRSSKIQKRTAFSRLLFCSLL